ncbi:MAG TPA: DUF1553 domain-containing protein [Pirellulaceae bacterium]|mgnify:CR=1 FL=1|nr:DUF1553 domain-containing protein [Pirellulaceae bacterium]HMO91695.1 DUF1553 domain-containing protein [Pirellulaceae bacterium]HMP68392.1 DUF1553 domain-containing protein [Pirellulaceae bacterium]
MNRNSYHAGWIAWLFVCMFWLETLICISSYGGERGGFVQDQESSNSVHGDARRTDDPVDFARDILPILDQHCISCHGPLRQESSLRFDVRESAIGVADWGEPVIDPGNSAGSLLYQFVTGEGDLLMPPAGTTQPLLPEHIDKLRRWIDEGADWPDEFSGDHFVELESDHWSFQPLHVVPPLELPEPANFPFINDIDRYIHATLADRQLAPSPLAAPETLIRRLYLNLHGLLPDPELVDGFRANPSRENYERIVDDALASPRYGERWARHWLDVVRFGESTGYEVNRDRANAYFYRDYVIDAFNRDISYRQFVMEQIAGDLLGADEATGFLVGGPYDIVKSPDINLTLMQREDELADFVNATSTAFLGLTVACARCHNHKFDPIPQRDYYAMQAVFSGVKHGERPLLSKADPELKSSIEELGADIQHAEERLNHLRSLTMDQNGFSELLPQVNAQQNVEEFEPIEARFVRFNILKTNLYEGCLDELEIYGLDDETNIGLASRGATVSSSGDYQGNPKHQLAHLNDGIYGNDKSWIAAGTPAWVQVALPEPQLIRRIVWGRDRSGEFNDRLAVRYLIEVSVDGEDWQEVSSSKSRRPIVGQDGTIHDDDFIHRLPTELFAEANRLLEQVQHQRERLRELEAQIPLAYVGEFREPATIRRLHRGDPLSPLEEVPPGALTLLGSLGLTSSSPEHERRLKFAEWIGSDDNPLTARVIVNRVWHYHFGRGLVWTTSDFGTKGDRPSHPELLDWLADEFIKNDWSLKWLHRLILTSSTFQQSSQPRPAAFSVDAESRLLWRFPPRRLEAEAIRDSVLQASGKLDLTMGGPGFLLFKIDRENVHHYFPLEEFEPQHFRRMIYMTKIRQEQDDVFGQFDCPDGSQVMPNRNQSTTALQSLNLLNSPFMLEQAKFFTERIEAQTGASIEEQVEFAYRILFARRPVPQELDDAVQFIREFGLPAFCRAMLNANEFLYVS